VAGLEVIARGSSNEYRGTAKRAQDIARELGAGYLLTGTVRWIKTADGASRVRVTPELVEVQPGVAPRTRWGEQFDAGLTDVFQVQADIAGKVVSALDVALADSVRQELGARPTLSVPAYDAFLKGEAATQRAGFGDARRGIAFYQEAIRLDSTFALAWSKLARIAAITYVNSGGTRELEEIAREAVEHARALAPNHPETYIAQASYEGYVGGDAARALATAEAGLRVSPNNADLLSNAASQEQTLGRFEAAVGRLERGFAIDPRSESISRRLGYALLVLRRYPEAKTAYDRGVTLAPGNVFVLQNSGILGVAQGDVGPLRRIAANPGGGVTQDQILAYLGQNEELAWTLERPLQDRMLELGPEAYDNDRSAWAIVRANIYWLRGDRAKMRQWGDTAEQAFADILRQAPDDAQQTVLRGVALAYAGRYDEAIREGKRGLELLPPSKDMYFGPYIQHQLVRIYLLAGQNERALDTLEPLLEMPYTLTPAWLRIDPMFDPLRKNPRFQKLVADAT
jgi:tetratricopeptide (TPR) repeat protein